VNREPAGRDELSVRREMTAGGPEAGRAAGSPDVSATSATELIYLYGIVPADAPSPPADLAGIDGGQVVIHPIGDVAAVIGRVSEGVYSDEPLNSRLDDLSWVGDRGLAHERVVDWFARRGPVIPLSLFSLHRSLARLESRVTADAAEFARLLDRLRGRREWGLRLWRRDGLAREGVDRLSPSLQQLAREIQNAPEGRRYLLARRRDAMRAEELRTVSSRLAHELFAALDAASADAVTIPIPPNPGAERVLLLDGAFLVADDAFEDFHAALARQAASLADSGFEIEFTGPWAPYHFTGMADD
jgi:hypothetical protein